MGIQKGDIIRVEYTGTFDDGNIFDSTDLNGGEPLKFEVGASQIIQGFDDSVIGKEVGEEYTIKLQPSEAYGERTLELVKKVPRSILPPEEEPKIGKQVILSHPQGHFRYATITNITDEEVSLDLNHPLAGKILNFLIKIVETGCEPDPPGCGCGCDHNH